MANDLAIMMIFKLLNEPETIVLKLFTSIFYEPSYNPNEFVSSKLFQPSPMLVGKARGLPYSGAPEKYFTTECSFLAQIY
jgi:hypothetical protein